MVRSQSDRKYWIPAIALDVGIGAVRVSLMGFGTTLSLYQPVLFCGEAIVLFGIVGAMLGGVDWLMRNW
jgi:hypothetical protein